MIIGREGLDQLVDIFSQQEASLYHACQLKDFESYVRLGGVPSRRLMETKKMQFTGFKTDDEDRKNWVWDKVFVNLQDFGTIFQYRLGKTGNSVPNPYGPILLELSPKALKEADNVAISMKSAGGRGFDRARDSIDLVDVEKLFTEPKRARIKPREELMDTFGSDEYGSNPEMSCSVPQQRLTLKHVKLIRVDPYVIEGTTLKAHVDRVVSSLGIDVYERGGPRMPLADGGKLYQGLFDALSREGPPPGLGELVQDPAVIPEVREWAKSIEAKGVRLTRQWPRFAGYLKEGTIDWLGRE